MCTRRRRPRGASAARRSDPFSVRGRRGLRLLLLPRPLPPSGPARAGAEAAGGLAAPRVAPAPSCERLLPPSHCAPALPRPANAPGARAARRRCGCAGSRCARRRAGRRQISCNLRAAACTGTPDKSLHARVAGRGPACRPVCRSQIAPCMSALPPAPRCRTRRLALRRPSVSPPPHFPVSGAAAFASTFPHLRRSKRRRLPAAKGRVRKVTQTAAGRPEPGEPRCAGGIE